MPLGRSNKPAKSTETERPLHTAAHVVRPRMYAAESVISFNKNSPFSLCKTFPARVPPCVRGRSQLNYIMQPSLELELREAIVSGSW